MHNLDLILTITGGLSAALILGYLTHRLRLSPIVGYLFGGILVGPSTPGFVADLRVAEQLAEIGIILLMFGVGLQFHLRELVAVRRVAVPGAIAASAVATMLGAAVGRAFGWDWPASIVFGLALSVASTVVLVRVLTDNRDLHTPTGHIAVGWVVVEDLFTVLALVLLPALLGSDMRSGNFVAVVKALGLASIKVAAMVTLTFYLGGRLVPWLLERVAATRSRELFVLTVLVVALGIAVGSAALFDVSMALGAFLGGMVVGRSEFSLRAASEALPLRHAFAVLFFVSVGMLFDPRHLLAMPGLVVATLGVVVIGKPLVALIIILALGYAPRVAFAVAAVLSQIGEFSFILGSLGLDLGVLSSTAHGTLIATAILSITLNAAFYRLIDPLEAWAARRPRLWRWLTARTRQADVVWSEGRSDHGDDEVHRAIVIGYGPIGRTVTRLLRENEVELTVIELNLETVRQLRAEGVRAVYGDAGRRETLDEAGARRAGSLIISADNLRSSEEVIRLARELNPDIRILARSAYVRQLADLRRAGADLVFSGEAEVALSVTEAVLRSLGATAEQIDRERERVRAELLGVASVPASERAG
jgi:CPA2 family monovalent cation:H+ antiporter-2